MDLFDNHQKQKFAKLLLVNLRLVHYWDTNNKETFGLHSKSQDLLNVNFNPTTVTFCSLVQATV